MAPPSIVSLTLGARLVSTPDFALSTLSFVAVGVVLGTVSGLTPGLHANNFALLLAAAAPSIPGSPTLVGTAMLAAGVVHTFLDIVPALALGVPDAAMAATALPGHRLVIAGRGREALRLSAVGSGVAVALATPLAVPVTAVVRVAYPTLRAHLSLVLLAVVGFLFLTEPSVRAALGGIVAFALSVALGAVALSLSPHAPLSVGSVLAPLFAGLFGAPVLLDALGGDGLPPQGDAQLAMPPLDLGCSAVAGTVAGALVGYLPGISAGVASVLSLPAVPGRSGTRGFVVATSGANTATTVFALFALVTFDAPRTGVMVALKRAHVPLDAPLLIVVTGLAAAVAFVLVSTVGDRYFRFVERVEYTTLCVAVLALLVVVSFLFAGVVGVGIFLASTLVGLVPPRVGTRRIHLMGVLIGPLALGL